MPFAVLRFSFLASVLLVGCGSTVIGGSGEGGSGDTTVAPSAGPGAPTGGSSQASAIALYEAEMIEAGGAVHCQPGGSCVSPDTLFLVISSEGASCSAPDARPSGTPSWVLHIGVPVEMQAIGIYDLASASPDLFVASGQVDSGEMSGVVTATGGFGAHGGTLEIVGLDETSVTFRLDSVLYDGDGDGQYAASRCGASTPPSGA